LLLLGSSFFLDQSINASGVSEVPDSTLLMTGESLGLNLESHQRADLANFLQMSEGQKAELLNKVAAGADEAVQTQWGFLKNIVNIDRFFSSGKGGKAADKDDADKADKKDEKKDEKKDDDKKEEKKEEKKEDKGEDKDKKDKAAKQKEKTEKADADIAKKKDEADAKAKDLAKKKEDLDAAQKKLDEKKEALKGTKASAEDKAEVAKLKAEVKELKKEAKKEAKKAKAADTKVDHEKTKKKIVLIKNYVRGRLAKIKKIQKDKTKPTAARQAAIDKIDAKIADKAARVDDLIAKLPSAERSSVSRIVAKRHKANPKPTAKNWKAKGKDFFEDLLNSDKFFKLSTDKTFATPQKFYVLSLADGKVSQVQAHTEDSLTSALKHFV